MQNQQLQNKKASKELRREILTLSGMGLEDYEIDYLLHLKQKEKARAKWR